MRTQVSINDSTYEIYHELAHRAEKYVSEIVTKKFYEVEGIDHLETVVDAGANIGVYSLYISRFAKQVYSIEPLTKNYTYLEKNIKENDIKNVKTYRLALAGQNGTRDIYGSEFEDDYGSATILPLGRAIDRSPALTLNSFLKEGDIASVDILKIDVENAEGEIFESPDFEDAAPKIRVIVGETHNLAPQIGEILRYYNFDFEVNPRSVFIAKNKKWRPILRP